MKILHIQIHYRRELMLATGDFSYSYSILKNWRPQKIRHLQNLHNHCGPMAICSEWMFVRKDNPCGFSQVEILLGCDWDCEENK